ncbi:ribosomal large subunit pseudouridine synthase B [Pasteurella canis]|uniref:Ribosomal large subunit pseudouridine synthase B n=1 Tax=Pasteurella canis TaxID=753 RepID=A0A379ERH9_9PAST|nr:ribosomal large subunit pseudouridine synthase B [Pasteurella canis]
MKSTKTHSHQNRPHFEKEKRAPKNPSSLKVISKTNVEGEKLQKVLARAGQGSRREIETMIAEKRVSVDGKIATLGDRINVHSGIKVRIDGHIVNLTQAQKEVCRVLNVLQTRR